ncbi:PREDICTED: uncharacterized protein LOC108748190 isoform X2 [Trachymyrmex septentrionalis]|uniref:uncharacterized protein LOC108748190 isoform X2 n=1 Tax=Trachymyrmex septentrionalis TaxID=34720 RepID=UPI00084F2FFF|nr:PREDICTED: uncharacterized protein LOC108748190 isoform X2 [Trachymyrmex septentrionalis]
MLNMRHVDKSEEKYIATINRIHDTIRKLEETTKYSRDLEAVRFLRYSMLKSRDKILTDDLRKLKIRNKQMLNLFRQSVTDVQLGSLDILPETLRRQVQKIWHQKYDALLSQNEQLKRQITALDCAMKQKQKEIDILQQKLFIAESVNSKGNTEKICRKCWILTNKT